MEEREEERERERERERKPRSIQKSMLGLFEASDSAAKFGTLAIIEALQWHPVTSIMHQVCREHGRVFMENSMQKVIRSVLQPQTFDVLQLA